MSDLSSGAARLPGLAGTDRAPTRIAGRYDIGEVIGVGAPAWVHRAEDRETGRVVAVKLYPTGFGGPDRGRGQLELGELTGLHHPNLVELLDAGDESGRAYLVMELVEARTLAQRLLDGTLAPGAVARLGADLGYALAYLHSKGITHRTVKPANVFLGDRPMLTDFGNAALVERVGVSGVESLIGTPAYLAPEQVSGARVGMPADVYALGLILLEALTGRREFEGDGPETARARLSRRPTIPVGVPALTDLLHAMTATDPAVRPAAGVVSEALRAAAPELDDVESVEVPAADDEGRRRPISTLERLEGLDALNTAVPLRRPGRPLTAATRDGFWRPAAAGGGARTPEPDVVPEDVVESGDVDVSGDAVEPGGAAVPDDDAAVSEDAVEPGGAAVADDGAESAGAAVSDDAAAAAGAAVAEAAAESGSVAEAAECGSAVEPGSAVESGSAVEPGSAAESRSASGSAAEAWPESQPGSGSASQPGSASGSDIEAPHRAEIPEETASGGRRVVSAAIGAGTKVLDVPAVPAGLPLPPPASHPASHRRDARRRRLLAAVLGATALAGTTGGILVSGSPEQANPGVADSAPADDAPAAQPPPPPPVPPAPAPPAVARGPRAAPPANDGGGGDSGGSNKHKGGKHGKKH